MKSLLSLTIAVLVAVSAQAQQPPPGPPPVDESLAPYASAENAVRLPDGRLLNFVCMGQGSPTVILTAGLGDFTGWAWAPVQAEMARTTRVCAWDRAGYGLSDGVAVPQTVAATTADLEAALATGRIPGPYVLVGHSLGSYESLLYADRHPDRVSGMVLVDPSYPDQVATLQRLQPEAAAALERGHPLVELFRKCAADIRSGALRAGTPDPNSCVTYPPFFPTVLQEALTAKVLGNPLQYESQAAFPLGVAASSREVINPTRNYGAMPLVVLTATVRPPSPAAATAEQLAQAGAVDEQWNRSHDELAALSTRGINARVPGANHYIQRSRPQVVIDAVEAVVREVRAAGS
jgi:pimeloyl-ACP methyl ester carboxylesterase